MELNTEEVVIEKEYEPNLEEAKTNETEEATTEEDAVDSEKMTMYVTIDPVTNMVDGLSSSYIEGSLTIEVNSDSDIFMFPFMYRYEDGSLVRDFGYQLRKSKESKIAELNIKCEEAILGYFQAMIRDVLYNFSFDREAQQNFTGSLVLFSQGIIKEIEWTAWIDGVVQRITLNYEEFLTLISIGFEHKNKCIHRYRNILQPLVESCETVEEVMAINW